MLSDYDELDRLRAALVGGEGYEEYGKQLARQNNGNCCEHCGSKQGHHRQCSLLNSNTGKPKCVTGDVTLSPQDAAFLKAMKVQW